jgi:hypothetical protein
MPLLHLHAFMAWTRTISFTLRNVMWFFNTFLYPYTILWFFTEKEENFTYTSRYRNITLGKAVQYNSKIGMLLSISLLLFFYSQLWTANAEVNISVRSRPFEILRRGTSTVNISRPIIFCYLHLKVDSLTNNTSWPAKQVYKFYEFWICMELAGR